MNRAAVIVAKGTIAPSWPLEESEVESCKHQDNADIHCQPFPKSVFEEQEIYTDYAGYHRHHVKRCSYSSVHFSFSLLIVSNAPRSLCRVKTALNRRGCLFRHALPRFASRAYSSCERFACSTRCDPSAPHANANGFEASFFWALSKARIRTPPKNLCFWRRWLGNQVTTLRIARYGPKPEGDNT